MRIIFLSIFTTCLFITGSAHAPKTVPKTKVVLDAGHGGTDSGAQGQFSMEKNLTLAIVLKLGRIISDSLKQTEVIYTRTSDTYPSLKDRHEIANQAAADIFVSVHINSSPYWSERVQTGTKTIKRGKRRVTVPVYKYIRHHETNANGAEVLVLGNIRNNQKADAMGEYGGNVVGQPGLLNENDPQTAIIIAQYTQAFLGRSIDLATHIQNQIVGAGRNDLGVKQQSLEVLAGSYMPGVLVECGFINNPTEEAYLNSEAGQQQIAMAIYRGIKAYLEQTK